MHSAILRHLPCVLALAATLWCVLIGVQIWQTPRVGITVTAQTAEEAARQPPTMVREVRPYSTSPVGMIPLAIPFILAAAATLIARLRAPGYMAVLVGLFLGYSFITGFSIGGAYSGPGAVLVLAVLLDAGLSFWDNRSASAAA